MRLRKKPWTKDEVMSYTSLIVETPEEHKNYWERVFQNNNPIHLEIGTGRGNFITTLANQNPNINYIALEQKQEVLVQAMRKANNLELTNIKFILGNANHLSNFFGAGELTRIYLNFSDPWPKKRHAKRRLTHRGFLDIYIQILKEDGEIHLKTDNELLFEFSLNEALEQKFILKNISLNLYRDEENIAKHVQTEYETLFMEKGKTIYRVEISLNDNQKNS